MDLDWSGTNIALFPRLDGETDDAPRIQRAIDASAHGVLLFPAGTYLLNTPVRIENYCSLHLAKEAVFLATRNMDYMVEWNGGRENLFHDYGMFISGGTFDGGTCSGGVRLRNIHHFTMRDSWYKDCRTGLCVGDPSDYKNYELIASNLYFRNGVGIAGSRGIYLPSHGDHHFDNIIVVDYEIAFDFHGYACFLNKCHSWVTTVIPDMRKTIGFNLCGGLYTLSDCYADTAHIGVRVCGGNNRITNLFGLHNYAYGGREHISISYETDQPFYLNGGNFVGGKDCDDIFFRGTLTPNVHMHWVTTSDLSGADFLSANGNYND